MGNKGLLFIYGILISFAGGWSAFGEDMPSTEELMGQIMELKSIVKKQNDRIKILEDKVAGQHEQIGQHTAVVDDENIRDMSARLREELGNLRSFGGLDIGAGATFIMQGTPNANNGDATDAEDSRLDGSWSADIEIAKKFRDKGLAFLYMESGQGDTVEGGLSLFSNVNRDAGDSASSVDITELWYEHYYIDAQVTVTAGKIDATGYIDTNEYANDECTQFLGHIFRNSAVIDWPDDNDLGVRVCILPEHMPFAEVDVLCMEEDGDWENLFDNPFIAAQLNFIPAEAFGYDGDKWGGSYRAYFWYNGAPHATVKDAGEIERGNVGWGISCDQMITDVYDVFGRFGWADPVKNYLVSNWSFGGRMSGLYWQREEDILATAVGQAVPGEEYNDVNEFHEAETHLEVYYSIKVNEHLSLTPDIQVIWDPSGGGTASGKDSDTIFVYGIRGQLDF